MQNKQHAFSMKDILTCLRGHGIAYIYEGDTADILTDTADLHTANTGDVAWFASVDYIETAEKTRASLVLTTEKLRSHVSDGVAVIITDNPRLAYAKIKDMLYPVPQASGYISNKAVIAPDVVLGDTVQIDDFAIIKSGADIQSGVIIGAYTEIGEGVKIGENTRIATHCHIENTIIGKGCVIQPRVTIGTDGFGFVLDFKNGHHSVPHTGGVVIGDNVHIGAGTCIDKGVESHTTIDNGSRLDNLVHIAHNIKIGKNCVIPAQVGMAGSVTIGDRVMFCGQAGVTDGVHIDDGAIVLMRAVVAKNVDKNQVVSGVPAREHKENLKREARLNKLLRK